MSTDIKIGFIVLYNSPIYFSNDASPAESAIYLMVTFLFGSGKIIHDLPRPSSPEILNGLVSIDEKY